MALKAHELPTTRGNRERSTNNSARVDVGENKIDAGEGKGIEEEEARKGVFGAQRNPSISMFY